MRVSANTSDAATVVTTLKLRSRNNAAARPRTKMMGPNTSTVVSVPANSGAATSSVPVTAASSSDIPSSRRRPTDSATTIAVSTNKPVPNARPPKLNTLIDTSSACSATNAISTDNGTVMPIASDNRQSRRNTKITSSDNSPPATISWPKFESASTTKSACAATTVIDTPGNSFSSCAMASVMRRVTATVFEPASLYTTMPMADVPSRRVSVCGSASPNDTVPTSRSVMPAPTFPTGVSRISAGVRNSVSARTEKRNCPFRMVPPAPVAFSARIAAATSSGVRSSARSFSGSSSTRISSSGAPTTATLDTPSICSSRRAWTSVAVRAKLRKSPPPCARESFAACDCD